MKQVFYFILFLTCCVSGNTAQDAFQLYESKKFTESLQAFLKIEKKGGAGSDLYFNIANVYGSLHQYQQAILYCERALTWNPHCEDCKEKLKQYNQAAGIDPYNPPPFFLIRAFNYISSGLHPIIWFLISMLCFSVLGFLWINKKIVLKVPYINQLLFFLGLLFLIFSFTENKRRNNNLRIVLMESSFLYVSPDTISEKKEELLPGEVFFITDKIGEWLKVRTKGLDIGWIEENKTRCITL